tara:strand:+ start:551 stop:862 length:312 start_codon:yes stop_codon:yes gene_type:complete
VNQTPVGTRNAGYTITSAVRLHSEGTCETTTDDYWVVLGHDNDGVMVSWQCRWLPSLGRWGFSGGHYANDAMAGFRNRITYELNQMVTRSKSRRDETKRGEEE